MTISPRGESQNPVSHIWRATTRSRICPIVHSCSIDCPNWVRSRGTEEAKVSAPLTALLLLDLDRFKEVNDTLGHAAGDKLLRMVSERLRALLGKDDFAARLGGDEFAILHPVTGADDTAGLARRIIEALVAPYDLEGHQANIGASIGISLAPADGTDPEALLRCADLALYRAKGQGRGDFVFFESEMTASAHNRRVLELELREALMLGQFEAHYQPQINVKTGLVSGAEALIRWRHPVRGLVGAR